MKWEAFLRIVTLVRFLFLLGVLAFWGAVVFFEGWMVLGAVHISPLLYVGRFFTF